MNNPEHHPRPVRPVEFLDFHAIPHDYEEPDIEEIALEEKERKAKYYSALICAYNEEPRIQDSVSIAKESPYIAEVVVVDDGSCDGTAHKAEEAGARVIQHDINQGKAAALRTGIQEIATPVTVLLDADIHNFAPDLGRMLNTYSTMRRGVTPYRGRYDMVIGSINHPGQIVAKAWSGQRIAETASIQSFFNRYPWVKGYGVDWLMYHYFRKENGRVKIVPMTETKHDIKASKLSGLHKVEVLKQYQKMWSEIAYTTVRAELEDCYTELREDVSRAYRHAHKDLPPRQ